MSTIVGLCKWFTLVVVSPPKYYVSPMTQPASGSRQRSPYMSSVVLSSLLRATWTQISLYSAFLFLDALASLELIMSLMTSLTENDRVTDRK